ncbi:MAG: beta-glucosidase [Alphaproteobacteria bacterium]|nr:beta-glucosidase [Alphaproteobacteria bacterium]
MKTNQSAPTDFLWGASTSAFQIEGATREDGRGPSVCDTLCEQKDGIANGDTADIACDHYHRWKEDVGLMGQLGLGAYRFSVSWSRVLPRGRGTVNGSGLEFYDRLIDGLLAIGVQPWLCLHHGDLPQALEDLGGWTNRDIVGWYADYAVLMARRFGDRVKHFATFNEPSVSSLFKYGFNCTTPGVPNRAPSVKAIHHMNLAHGAGVDVLRALVADIKIGCIHGRQPAVPELDDVDGRKAAAFMDEHWNLAFPDPQILGFYPPMLGREIEPYMQPGDLARICRPVDWFGMNYYCPLYTRHAPWGNWGIGLGDAPDVLPKTPMGWAIVPEAFRQELLKVSRCYNLPIYVTENGYGSNADVPGTDGEVKDQYRIDYLEAHISAMRHAMVDGADVRGYFVWSLLDNFEWGAGYSQRFGLIYVDYATLKRTPKASALWYANLIKSGSLHQKQ